LSKKIIAPKLPAFSETMPAPSLELVRNGLLSVGYRADRLENNVPVPEEPGRKVGLVAYSDQPFDARTSAFAAAETGNIGESGIPLLKPLGAPIIALCEPKHALFWKQAANQNPPEFIERVPSGKIASFFRQNEKALAPDAVYRAKVWGRMDKTWQLDFVDSGLLPVIEESAGESLRKLLERTVTLTKAKLGWKEISAKNGRWLLQSVFWLLGAKILKDKRVPGFIQLNLSDLEEVYLKLAKHYNKHDPQPIAIGSARKRDALLSAAEMIGSFGHCGAVTTESLAWVYESALIDRATRQKLGTHSTPAWLVDDIVARLRPWIEEMPVDERHVFEPACGHAGFLISAMRLLSELLPKDQLNERKAYLRKRLRGIEIDPFAYEIARLSLTLADIPNDNGWMLENGDMFENEKLPSGISEANIVLANPPFEGFGDGRPEGAMHSRADETFRQIVDGLPVGGVFGIVMPQTVLRSRQAKELRQRLFDEYEISDITLFADKVFRVGEPEIAVLLGKRTGQRSSKHHTIRCRRVREDRVDAYRRTLDPSSELFVSQSRCENRDGSLLVPELADVWESLDERPHFGELVTGGKGFQHKGKKDSELPRNSVLISKTRKKGLTKGFVSWNRVQLTHELPKAVWINLLETTISRPRHGTIVGESQILLNYAPVGRGAWRLKALVDQVGHPVNSRFHALRPANGGHSLWSLWAICNSPVANAYFYCMSSKRDILQGDLFKLPTFNSSKRALKILDDAVRKYFDAAEGASLPNKNSKNSPESADTQLSLYPEDNQATGTSPEELKHLHWRIDAEVLRLYDLTPESERKILELFTGVRRPGVPFIQNEYFPAGFNELDRLSELLAITADWEKTNRHRSRLIRKDVKSKLSSKETSELAELERLADARIELMDLQNPTGPSEIDKTVERLKLEGRWPEDD